MLTLDTKITDLSRVGKTTARRLEKIGLKTTGDLLFYFPFRWEDFSKLTPIAELKPGLSANIVGRIELIQNKRSPRKKMYITEALIRDETESVRAVWFNQPFIAKNLRAGDLVSLAGKAEKNLLGAVLISPNYEKIQSSPGPVYQEGDMAAIHTHGLVPIYHLTNNITQKQLRFLIKQVIQLAKLAPDWLPYNIKKRQALISLAEALEKIHFPKNISDLNQAKRRLAFDEIFILQIQSQLIKMDLRRSQAASIKFKEKETKIFVGNLPFKLTADQRQAAWEILKDIENNRPMARLLEGDVGSGKTVVALIAMLNAVLNNRQAALMAPTEILARQHYKTACRFLGGWNIKIGLATRTTKKANYEVNKENKIKNQLFIIHNSDIIIGTHALLREDACFKNLALAVIDEQHRFGVEQRAKLLAQAYAESSSIQSESNQSSNQLSPHLLSMTATPIPRSLALALYGDLDLSIIKQMPLGRKKIITKIIAEESRGKAYQFIRGQIKEGRQVFVVCPLIDASDKLGVKSAKEEFKKLDRNIFPDINMGILHGRMKAKEKEETMRSFLENKIKILVSTSVVEVGIDIPNATIMMVEGADRFGLAQLHQFRGRVGRGEQQSYCFLFTESDSPNTIKRMEAMVKYNDGFILAKMDLKFRGPGEVYGLRQAGFPELKIASLFDYELMKQVKEEAEKIINEDASLNKWPLLKEKIEEKKRLAHLE